MKKKNALSSTPSAKGNEEHEDGAKGLVAWYRERHQGATGQAHPGHKSDVPKVADLLAAGMTAERFKELAAFFLDAFKNDRVTHRALAGLVTWLPEVTAAADGAQAEHARREQEEFRLTSMQREQAYADHWGRLFASVLDLDLITKETPAVAALGELERRAGKPETPIEHLREMVDEERARVAERDQREREDADARAKAAEQAEVKRQARVAAEVEKQRLRDAALRKMNALQAKGRDLVTDAELLDLADAWRAAGAHMPTRPDEIRQEVFGKGIHLVKAEGGVSR